MMSNMIHSQNQRNVIIVGTNDNTQLIAGHSSSIVSKRRRRMMKEEEHRHHYDEEQLMEQRYQLEAEEERYALASLIIQLNEEGIKLFRQSNLLTVSRSFECFEQAASNLACLTSSIVAEQEHQIRSKKRRCTRTGNERPLLLSQPAAAASQQQYHDYEQAKLISITSSATDVCNLSSLEGWVHVVGTVVLHNLGLVALKRASVAGADSYTAKAIETKGLELLKLCLNMTSEYRTNANEESSLWYGAIVYQIETSANYLMGFTLYKQATKLRQTEDSVLLLQQSMKYLLDGLDSMNVYQSSLLNQHNILLSEQDTTSLPIGLFSILGNVLYLLDKPQYAMEAFERCSWFVQSRQQQQQQQAHSSTLFVKHPSVMTMDSVIERITSHVDTSGAPAA